MSGRHIEDRHAIGKLHRPLTLSLRSRAIARAHKKQEAPSPRMQMIRGTTRAGRACAGRRVAAAASRATGGAAGRRTADHDVLRRARFSHIAIHHRVTDHERRKVSARRESVEEHATTTDMDASRASAANTTRGLPPKCPWSAGPIRLRAHNLIAGPARDLVAKRRRNGCPGIPACENQRQAAANPGDART